jgi:hypothetical protein
MGRHFISRPKLHQDWGRNMNDIQMTCEYQLDKDPGVVAPDTWITFD